MLKSNCLFPVLMSLCIAVSCDAVSGGESPIQKPDDNQELIPITLSLSTGTKATDNEFEPGDEVGLFVVNQGSNLAVSGNHVNNMRFAYWDGWIPDQEIYWASQTTPASFYCYYPYNSTVSSVDSYPVTINADQSTESGYKASDFLFGKAMDVTPSLSPVGITLKHVMSNLIVTLTPGKGYTESDLNNASIAICGLAPTLKLNMSEGSGTATGAPLDITPKKENGYYKALVVPQEVDGPLVKIIIGGYQYTLNQNITFVANKQHRCTITINKTSNGINIGIGGWDTDDIDYGGTID